MISKENAIQVDVDDTDEHRGLSRKKKPKVSTVEDVKAAQISSQEDCSKGMKSKLKTASRSIKKKLHSSINKTISKENSIQVDVDGIDEPPKSNRKKKPKVSYEEDVQVAQISSGEDCSKGMKRKFKAVLRSEKKKFHLSSNKVMPEENAIKVDMDGIDVPTKLSKKKKPKVNNKEVKFAQFSSDKLKTASRSKKKKLHLSSNKMIPKENSIQVDVDNESSKSSGKKKPKVSYEDVKVVQISSGEDCSKGMKKWLHEYQKSRPGLKMLQQHIDQFMTDYEAEKEKERREKDAELAKDGFQLVEHHKGRKKTTDTESGITVGSVAQVALMNNMIKKKNKEVPVDFYRFQKREARRNEIMMLQDKFEKDKKRIQQLRATRRFRPY